MHAQQLVSFLSVLTVIGQVIVAALIIGSLIGKGRQSAVFAWLGNNALWLMLIVALTAASGSLYFSEIAGWAPCKLCWLQRIFMYPQVVLLAMALWKRDRNIVPYILALSVIGIVIAVYHYGIQMDARLHPVPVDELAPCDASGVSCSGAPFFRFGYITIPMMALTAFALNIAGSWMAIRRGSA